MTNIKEFNQNQNPLFDEYQMICESKDLIEYITNCRMLEIPVDSYIASSLASNFDVLEPSDSNSTGKLLPLVNILKRTDYIRKIIFPSKKSVTSGNSEANILGLVLATNQSIIELDISYHNIGKEGLEYLCAGIVLNKHLEILNISGNQIGPQAAPIIIKMISDNNSLNKLFIKNMNIEYDGIQEIYKIANQKKINLEYDGNYVYEESLYVAINLMGTIMSLAAFYLLYNSINATTPFQHKWSRMIYGLSLCALFISSVTRYMFRQWTKNVLSLLTNLDYIMIYVVIASTHTPILVDSIGIDNLASKIILVVEWLLCFFGIILHLAFNDRACSSVYVDYIEVVIFMIMGWSSIFIIMDISDHMHSYGLTFFLLGGALYSFGIIFYYIGKNIPIYHVVWYICVLIGSLSIFLSIFYYLKIDGYNMNGNKLSI